MRQHIIGVDVDGVCADLMTGWLGMYNDEHGDCLTVADIKGWGIHEYVKCGKKIYDYLGHPELYEERVQPIPGALEAVKILRQDFRVVFVTSVTTRSAGRKIKWLRQHGFMKDAGHNPGNDYVECDDKTLVNVSLLIDDKVETCMNFHNTGRKAILFASPLLDLHTLPALAAKANDDDIVIARQAEAKHRAQNMHRVLTQMRCDGWVNTLSAVFNHAVSEQLAELRNIVAAHR